ncbi:DUF5615 family PIN-like protein [Sporichthya polymorpha]|uniref:DUF5615 family PIN-like protein n=1 Tax=Sporichthya polymorpha TaxID=35751 RepID=UPI0003811D92|nr:DUF5615 family PIN-like protein [Sporichthya polymorpha]
MRFLIDEMFPAATVELLTSKGHDAVHVIERGLGARPDAELVALAKAESRVLVTENVQDFALAPQIAVACVLKSRLRVKAMAVDLAELLDSWAAGDPEPLPGLYWPPVTPQG